MHQAEKALSVLGSHSVMMLARNQMCVLISSWGDDLRIWVRTLVKMNWKLGANGINLSADWHFERKALQHETSESVVQTVNSAERQIDVTKPYA